jgi:hypothetical protein
MNSLIQIERLLAPNLLPALKITVGAIHAESGAIGANAVLLCSTTDCHITFGSSPAATTADTFLPAKVLLVVSCLPTDKISVIQDSAGGYLFATPVA